MPDRSWTILILPHSKTRFRKVRITERRIRLAVGAVALLALAAAVLPVIALSSHRKSSALEDLRAAHASVLEEQGAFEASLDAVDQRLGSFEQTSRRIADALGIEDLATEAPAVGGPTESVSLDESRPFADTFNAFESRAEMLDASLHRLSDAWMERERQLASTPAIMPVRGWLSDGYGWRKDPFTSKRAFHRGVDIVAARGTPVLASADGVVAKAGRLSAYGKRIDLSHGFGFITRYAHLNEILVKPGQEIRRGDVIGRVGSTGRSTAPHLHYEVFRDGRRVNPWKYLADKDG